ncbi:MAG: protein-L-isoaspartate(D-aspartate) O-methyltransferase [bacterium]
MTMVIKYGIVFLTLMIIFIPAMFIFNKESNTQNEGGEDFKSTRKNMVKYQIEARGIKNKKVLNAFKKVPRHKFVPKEYIRQAYNDGPLPIGKGQTISQPYVVAFMTDVLNLKKHEKVLEIGTGSGYQAAILAEICDSVFSIEIFKELGNKAKQVLESLGYKNIFVKIGDGYKGWKEHAPFDAVIVTCAPTNIPQPLIEQLKENGRMIIPIGERWSQELVLLKKTKGKIEKKEVLPVRFVPMIDSAGKNY